MLVNTKAIVLSAIKYGESDLIIKCYTEDGVRSYMIKRILKSRNSKLNIAYFQPLNLLQLTAKHNSKGTLNSILEVHVYHVYTSIPTDLKKQAIVMFLAETLNNALKEESKNEDLFHFLSAAFQWLDTHEKTINFHLIFLLKLTKHLGFYPEVINSHKPYFSLEEGIFSDHPVNKESLSGENLSLFKTLIGTNFDVTDGLNINSNSRHALLDMILSYYTLHLPGFKKPRSLAILKELFREK
ncbi:MAG: DNA repair protein RecO [Flavobacteriaceae bacterium]|nr:DNA repair protein RecO [Flavobacteriaceae bacterium]